MGTYTLFTYGAGGLSDNGLLIGTIPAGFNAGDFTIDTSIAGQVNLGVLLGAGPFYYWDGSNTVANGTVDGGAGTWNGVNTNWTNAAGNANGVYGGAIGIFRRSCGRRGNRVRHPDLRQADVYHDRLCARRQHAGGQRRRGDRGRCPPSPPR